MKFLFYSVVLATFCYACSPKISSTITNKQPALGEDEFVLVLQKEDNFNNDGIEIGRIRSGDNGMSSGCTYYEVIGKLRQLARSNGANLIKITEHKSPDQWSTCDRLSAKIYKVPNFRIHEKEIEWTEERKLIWEDFKGMPKTALYPNAAALTYCGFAVQTATVTMFSKPRIFTVNTFTTNLSWVLPGQKDRTDLLEHEQGHFDLSEIYTRKLREQLEERKMTSFNLTTEANTIFKDVYAQYLDRQELYEKETQNGLYPIKQHEWTRVIGMELRSLRRFIH